MSDFPHKKAFWPLAPTAVEIVAEQAERRQAFIPRSQS
jgi:hypothetical protein